jgi:hypothetical protein
MERINTCVWEVQEAINPSTKHMNEEDKDDGMLTLNPNKHHYIAPSKNVKLEFDSLDLDNPAAMVSVKGFQLILRFTLLNRTFNLVFGVTLPVALRVLYNLACPPQIKMLAISRFSKSVYIAI